MNQKINNLTILRRLLSTAVIFCGAGVLADARLPITEGWENINRQRREFPVGVEVWSANLGGPGAIVLEQREGATGSIEIRNGELHVRKTNGKGCLLIKAAPFAAETNLMLRFSADVHVADAEPEFSHGFLRAYGNRESVALQPAGKAVEGYGGRNLMWGLVNQAPGMFYRKYQHYRNEDGTVTPVIVIAGEPSVSVWKNWRAERHDVAKRLWQEHVANQAKNRISPKPVGAAEFDRFLRSDIEHTAKIVKDGPRPLLKLDGRIERAVAFHSVTHHQDYSDVGAAKPLVAAGVPLFVTMVHGGTANCDADRNWTSAGYNAKKAAREVYESMRAETNALFVIAYDCNAYRDYVAKDHPDQGWINAKGKPVCGSAGSCCVGYQGMTLDQAWPWVSMASEVWKNDVKANIRAFVAELKRLGVAKRIVGIHTYGYNDGQFGMVYGLVDHSPMAKAAYEKYCAAHADRPISYLNFYRQLGVLAQEEFARAFKEAMGKEVIAIRWCDGPFIVDFGITEMTASDAIDVIVTQPGYVDRGPAIAHTSILPYSSINLHGRMHWSELDHRTWYVISAGSLLGLKEDCFAEDIESWRSSYRKLAGEMIAERSGFWFYDMGRGWFAAPSIAADVADSLATMRELDARPASPWRPSVAFVADEFGFNDRCDSLGWLYHYGARHLRALAGAGVPYEFYLAEDVIKNSGLLEDTKLVVFMLWRQFDERRLKTVRALAKPGRTLVFLSESGQWGGAKEATGFTLVNPKGGSHSMAVKAVPGVEVLGSLDIESVRDSDFGKQSEPYVRPYNVASAAVLPQPGVKVLATYEADGTAAIAERTDDGCRKLYFATPGGMGPKMFNRLARESGAYVPTARTGLVVHMNGDFISLHALRGGRYDFKLPFACEVVNVKSGEVEVLQDGVLPLNLTPGETCWFLLKAKEMKQ